MESDHGYLLRLFGLAWDAAEKGVVVIDFAIALIAVFVIRALEKWNKLPAFLLPITKHAFLEDDKWRLAITFAIIFVMQAVLISPYSMDKANRATIVRLQQSLDDKSPKLEGFVDRIASFDEPGTSNSMVFLEVSVSNSGHEPSSAEQYDLRVILSTNSSANSEELKFSDEYKLNFILKDQLWLLDLQRHQLIAEKTIRAIPVGEPRRGWLAYRLHGLKIGQYKQTNVAFSFIDINGKRIGATNGFWRGKPTILTNTDDFAMTIPGAENIFYPVSPEIRTNWLPPELPQDCSNVVVFLGSSGIIYSRLVAEISPEKLGTKFAIKDLPDFMLPSSDKMPNYSPHLENMWLRWDSAKQGFGDKTVDLPVLPFVVSNRFYVDVQIPFSNEKRKLVMSREFDSALTNLPKSWDWNYSTNYNSTYGRFYYEIVNEFANPVLQVFYTAPNEIHVLGIFIVNTNQLLETFGGPPQLLKLSVKLISEKSGKEITNAREIKKELGTNTIGSLMTNYMYGLKFPESKTIFKYPFNRNANAFSDWTVQTNKSDTNIVDKSK
jgi:hypothetical protein